MATEFADMLQDAIDKTNFYANSYVWKGKKVKDENGNFIQEEVRLVDATEDQLRSFYAHCVSMLNNTDKQNPGRYPLMEIIQLQKDRCGVELFLRESEQQGTSRYTIIDSIKQVIRYSGITQEESKAIPLNQFINVDSQFQNLPIKLVQDGCLQKLGKFDNSHLTLTFILKQGLRITNEEEQELTEYTYDSKGNSIKRKYIDVVRERLNIAAHMKLRNDPRGLTYAQLRAMLNLRNRNYNDLTTDQLKTLRNRVLFALEDEVAFHIEQWETRLEQLNEVAELKGISL